VIAVLESPHARFVNFSRLGAGTLGVHGSLAGSARCLVLET